MNKQSSERSMRPTTDPTERTRRTTPWRSALAVAALVAAGSSPHLASAAPPPAKMKAKGGHGPDQVLELVAVSVKPDSIDRTATWEDFAAARKALGAVGPASRVAAATLRLSPAATGEVKSHGFSAKATVFLEGPKTHLEISAHIVAASRQLAAKTRVGLPSGRVVLLAMSDAASPKGGPSEAIALLARIRPV